MASWDRVAADLVIGSFEDHQIETMRREFNQLRELVLERTREAPGLLPFSAQVLFVVTAKAPEDERLRAILASYLPDEPEWVWQWHELELWHMIARCCELALSTLPDEGAGTQVEVRTIEQAQALVGVTNCIAAVAGWRASVETDAELREDYEWFHSWCRESVAILSRVAAEPPLPQLQ